MTRWPIILALASTLYAGLAVGLPITGSITAGVTSDFRPDFDLTGPGYRLDRFELFGEAMHVAIWGVARQEGSMADVSGTTTVNGPTLQGALTFHVEPFRWGMEPAPFTMTGTINGEALEGSGMALVSLRQPHNPVDFAQAVRFDFAAPLAASPEPATLFLIGTGLAAAGIRWRRACMRRGVTSARA